MILGQSAATAAVLALEKSCPVQELPYAALRARLLADGQVLRLADKITGAPASRNRASTPIRSDQTVQVE
jgi:hypothetical protein